MRTTSTLLVLLATSASLLTALPTPQNLEVNDDANERADDGSKAVENELKIQESIELQKVGCFGGVIEGAACEKVAADFEAKIAAALGADDAAAGDKGQAQAGQNGQQGKDQGNQGNQGKDNSNADKDNNGKDKNKSN